MWTNLREEILAKSKLLRDNGYEYTGKWCEHICTNLNEYTRLPQMLDKDLGDVISTFKQEYVSLADVGSQKLREKYLTIIQVLLEKAIRNSPNPKQMFDELLPFLEQGMNTAKTTSEVARVFRDLDEQFIEIRIYESLFVFMLHVEGEYFSTIRTLCGFRLASKGKSVNFQSICKMPYDNVRKELGRFGKPLFSVYDDVGRYLRNAVAHACFKYKHGRLTCWNIEPRTRKETWRKDFTYDELSNVLVDIYSISHAFLYWYMLRELADKILHHVKTQLS